MGAWQDRAKGLKYYIEVLARRLVDYTKPDNCRWRTIHLRRLNLLALELLPLDERVDRLEHLLTALEPQQADLLGQPELLRPPASPLTPPPLPS